MTSAEGTITAEAIGEHVGTLIFLHGLGDTGAGWFSTFQALQRTNPGIKIVCPTAPVQPVTLNRGMSMPSWYDIKGFDKMLETYDGIEKTFAIVKDLIQQESKLINADKIVLGGFSQGAAMSMYVGFQFPESLAAIVALSGYLPLHTKFPEIAHEANKNTKLFAAHGNRDNTVKLEFGQLAHDIISSFNPNAIFKVYPNLQHSVSKAEEQQVKQFIISSITE